MFNKKSFNAFVYTLMTVCSLVAVLPIFLIVIVSITKESVLTEYGFSLIPRVIDFTAYKMLFKDSGKVVWYTVWTLFLAIVRPLIVILVTVSYSYALTREKFIFKNFFTKFILFTMFFSGGMIPTYVIVSNVYHLVDNPIYYFLEGWIAFSSVVIFRTFFKQVPQSLIEAAKIDGATESQVLMKVILPMSTTIIGIQYFTTSIGIWNDYQTSLIYMFGNDKFWTIQYYMQRVLQDASFLKTSLIAAGLKASDIPENGLKYAMCLFSLLPIFIIFPFVQKYFAKGIAVGSVKG